AIPLDVLGLDPLGQLPVGQRPGRLLARLGEHLAQGEGEQTVRPGVLRAGREVAFEGDLVGLGCVEGDEASPGGQLDRWRVGSAFSPCSLPAASESTVMLSDLKPNLLTRRSRNSGASLAGPASWKRSPRLG